MFRSLKSGSRKVRKNAAEQDAAGNSRWPSPLRGCGLLHVPFALSRCRRGCA